MRRLYKNIYRVLMVLGLFAGGLYFFPGCSSFEDGMIGSFPFLEINLQDTVVSNDAQTLEIPVNTNREWSVRIDYSYGEQTAEGWAYASPSADYKTLKITLKDNFSETDRMVVFTVMASNGTAYANVSLRQEASSDKTFRGNLIIRTQEELENNMYTKVTGALVIGNLYSDGNLPESKASAGVVNLEIDGAKLTVGTSNIYDLSAVAKISTIGAQALYVLNTKVKKLPGFLQKYGLVKLAADYNELTSLDSIIDIQSFQKLTLSHNKIKDISGLRALKNITTLNIAYNQIGDISVLRRLPRLSSLVLGEDRGETNQITDLSVLNSMANLRDLSLNGLPVDEMQIQKLNLPAGCEVRAKDLKGSPLPLVSTHEPQASGDGNRLTLTADFQMKSTPGITVTVDSCGFYYGTVNDLDQMEYAEGVKRGNTFTAEISVESGKRYYIYAVVVTNKGRAYGELQTYGENIHKGNIWIKTEQDIEDFIRDGFSLVEGAIVIGNVTADGYDNTCQVVIDGVKYNFAASTIDDISFLSGVTEVKNGIYLGNTQVTNLAPLARNTEISRLWLKKNRIERLPDLSSVQGLNELNLSGNRISDISALAGLTTLRVLALGDRENPDAETNTITDISALYELRDLQELDLSGLPLTQQMVEAFRQLFPACTVYAEGLKTPKTPEVLTGQVTEVTATSGRLNATLVSAGDGEVTEYGFLYGEDTTAMQRIVIGGNLQNNTFDYLLNGLELGKHYYFRAFAVNEYGEGRGTIREFVTAATYTGNVFLHNQQEVDDWINQGYSRIKGKLIVGNAVTDFFEGYELNLWVNGQNYYFGESDISNINTLSVLTEVTEGIYILANAALNDITPLGHLVATPLIDLSKNSIQDISPLTGISGLTTLTLNGNPVNSWDVLPRLDALNILSVSNCNLPGLSVLSELNGLIKLVCQNNHITDLTPLKNMAMLSELDISQNEVEDLTPLSALSKLSYLYCSSNKITTLEALQEMNLQGLSCSYNQISDIAVLQHHTNLSYLVLGGGSTETNTISDITVLKQLTNLRTLFLNGLPLSQEQVDELKEALPACDIYASGLKQYAPVLTGLVVNAVDNTTVEMSAEITDQGIAAITERGFWYGTENNLASMSKITVSGKMTGRYTYRLSGLEQATTYYVIAFASNGVTTAYTSAMEVQTEGTPVVKTLRMQSGNNAVEGEVTYTGGTITAYGAVWSLVGEPTVNSYEGIKRIPGEVVAGEGWTAELTGLKPGYTYQVRCFAENKYGTAYGEVIPYTVPGELTKYNYVLEALLPDLQVGQTPEPLPVNMLYAYYFKEGLTGQGEALQPGAYSNKQYTYSLAEGEQKLVFCNLNASGSNYTVQSLLSSGHLLSIRQTEGNGGIGTDVVMGSREINMNTEVQEQLELKREVARMNIAVQAKNADGTLTENLSEVISEVKISLGNFYAELLVSPELTASLEGKMTNVAETAVNSTGTEQVVAENMYVFPTIAGQKNAVTLQVKLKDGRSLMLYSQLPEAIVANHGYSVMFTIAGSKSGHSFTLEDITIEEEIIEF